MLRRRPTEQDIRTRAYFIAQNCTGTNSDDPVSNWSDALVESVNARYRLPYVVVDQNCLRNHDAIMRLREQTRTLGWRILLPDVALMEMTKSDRWEDTVLHSLRLLAQEPALAAVALGLGELMRAEQASRAPVSDVIDNEATPLFQQLLAEIAADRVGEMRRLIRSQITEARELSRKQHLRHEHNKDTVERIAAAIREEFKRDDIRSIANLRERRREFWSSVTMTNTCVIALTGAGYPEKLALLLAAEPSVSGYFFFALAALVWDWVAKGGLAGAAPDKLTNDIVDLDYVILGAMSAGLVTDDGKARTAYQQLCEIADARWDWLRELYLKEGVPIWS